MMVEKQPNPNAPQQRFIDKVEPPALRTMVSCEARALTSGARAIVRASKKSRPCVTREAGTIADLHEGAALPRPDPST